MSVTSLTGTTWVLNTSLTYSPFTFDGTPWGKETYIYADVVSNGSQYIRIRVRDNNNTVSVVYRNGDTDTTAYQNGWVSEDYRTITFLGEPHWDGSVFHTATVAEAISWLEANAVRVAQDVEVSLGGSYIATLNNTGSVTLATQNTYLTNDITIDYTKSGGGTITEDGNGDIELGKTGDVALITPLSVTANDTYTAPANTGYSPVDVNVSGGGGVSPSGSLNITNNGTYDITNYAEVVVSVSVPIEYIDYTYTVSGSTETWNLGKSPNQIKALLDQGKIVFVQIPNGSYTQVFGCTRSSSSASTYWLIYIEKIYEGGNIYTSLRAIPSYTANGINGTFSYGYTSGGSND
jgi:hypothetical protein